MPETAVGVRIVPRLGETGELRRDECAETPLRLARPAARAARRRARICRSCSRASAPADVGDIERRDVAARANRAAACALPQRHHEAIELLHDLRPHRRRRVLLLRRGLLDRHDDVRLDLDEGAFHASRRGARATPSCAAGNRGRPRRARRPSRARRRPSPGTRRRGRRA